MVMCIVGSGRADLFAPTVLAVLACDWPDDVASFKLLEVIAEETAHFPQLQYISGRTFVRSGGLDDGAWYIYTTCIPSLFLMKKFR